LATAVILAFGLAGCGSISERVAGTASESPLIGLPAGTPARPETPMPFPAVHDMPPARPNTVLSDAEQQKMEDDLVAARDNQQKAAGNKQALRNRPKPKPDKPSGKPADKAKAQAAGPATTSSTAASRPSPTSSSRATY